ncbi:MAG TPA: aminotransferase class IV [Leptospiraceae bacterium]|nr:aminotransferase class IV [Leptospiraceae bacterium]
MYYLNGKSENRDDFVISLGSVALKNGFSLYETLFILKGKPVFIREHLDRLKHSMEYFSLSAEPGFFENIRKDVKKLISETDLLSGRIRIMIFPSKNITLPADTVLLPEKLLSEEALISLKLSKVRKPFPPQFPSFVKISSNHCSLLSFKEAYESGFDEGLMLDSEGRVTETSYGNLFWIKNNEIFTPSADLSILNGVTRMKIIEICRISGLKLCEGYFSLSEILNSDSAYVSSSSRGMMRISRIDDTIFNEHSSESVCLIRKKYDEAVENSLNEYEP